MELVGPEGLEPSTKGLMIPFPIQGEVHIGIQANNFLKSSTLVR